MDLGLTLVSDKTMARLNEALRGVAGPTDVLSFPESEVCS
jgi:ssRNA-specific RNase YbeY (16S rRNA maturation enzyme)